MTIWTANSRYTCGWSLDDDWCVPCKGKIPGPDASDAEKELFQNCVDTAAEILYALSGRQFGLCEVTVRPCRKVNCSPCAESANGLPWSPARTSGGDWINVRCNTCSNGDDCSCSEICEIELPGRVDSITSVTLNGETLPDWMYQIHGRSVRNRLVRVKEYKPLTGPVSFVYLVNVQPGSTVCDISPPPDSVVGASGPVGDCYTPTTNNPEFHWNNLDTAEVTLNSTTTDASYITTFFEGDYPDDITGTYLWPQGLEVGEGENTVSELTPNGSFMRITVLSGSMKRYDTTPYGWELTPGTTIRMERLGPVEGGCWPACQDMLAPLTGEGSDNTWGVTYMKGLPVPAAGRRALAELACELCLACLGDSCCTIPKRVLTLSTEGGTMTMLDPMNFIEKGLTGLYAVDLWIQSVNPKKLARRAAIISPDSLGPRRVF